MKLTTSTARAALIAGGREALGCPAPHRAAATPATYPDPGDASLAPAPAGYEKTPLRGEADAASAGR